MNDIKGIAVRETIEDARRRAAEARLRRLEVELARKFQGQPHAEAHVARELADLRRAMLIELECDPPATVGSLLDGLVRLTRRGT